MRWPPKPWLAGILAAALLSTAVAAVGAARRPDALRSLIIAAGGRGGVYHAYGQALAAAARKAYPQVHSEVLTTAASVENLRLVADGRADVGFALADSAALAVGGDGPFATAQPLRALAFLYDNYTQLVVRAESPIKTVADLRGRTVSLGAPGSGTELVAGRILTATGLRLTDLRAEHLDLGSSVTALADGAIAAFFFSGGLPTPAIADLATRIAIRLVALDGLAPTLRAEYGDFYAEWTIPATVYDLPGEIATIRVPNYLVVRADMPDDVAYTIVDLLFRAKAELVAAHPEALHLDPRSAVDTFPLKLHPGAQRYYRDTKP